MTLKKAFIHSLRRFQKLVDTLQFPFWKILVYALFLTCIMTIPTFKDLLITSHAVKEDVTKIAKALPDFEIKQQQLQPKDQTGEKGKILMTDSLIVTFDPNGKRNPKEIAKDTSFQTIAIGLLKKQIQLDIPHVPVLVETLGKTHFTFAYKKEWNGMTKQQLVNTTQLRLPVWSYLIFFFVLLYPMFFILLFSTFWMSLFAQFLAHLKRIPLKYFPTFKLVLFSSTWGVCLSSVLQLFHVSFNQSYFIPVLTLIVYLNVLKAFPKVPIAPPKQ